MQEASYWLDWAQEGNHQVQIKAPPPKAYLSVVTIPVWLTERLNWRKKNSNEQSHRA